MDQLLITLLPQLQSLQANDDALGVRLDLLEGKLQWLYGGGAVVVLFITAWELIRVVIHL